MLCTVKVIHMRVLPCEVNTCVLHCEVMHTCVLHGEVTHTCVLHGAGTLHKFSELALSLLLPS